MADLKRAFELDDYDMDGLVSGEYHVYGNYETPLGFGRLVIEQGTAYGETFDSATSTLRFEGTGVRLDSIQITKSTGSATGTLRMRRWNAMMSCALMTCLNSELMIDVVARTTSSSSSSGRCSMTISNMKRSSCASGSG